MYFKIAWRNIIKRKFYSMLTISGLALGIACSIFIYLYISFHLSFDTYHPDADRTFRLVNELHLEKTEYDKGASIAMFRALASTAPQVTGSGIMISKQSFIVDVGGSDSKRFREEKTCTFTNADWFKVFRYRWLQGYPAQLNEPNTVALTQKQALKYFGSADPMGKTLLFSSKPVKVIGVIADGPYNTDYRSDIYLSLSSFQTLIPGVEKEYFTGWGYFMSVHSAFITLKNKDQQQAVEAELKHMAEQHMGKDISKYYTFKLLPLKQLHFDGRYGGSVQKRLLWILGLIGTLIIVIAGINYVNMVIAQQARRSMEIGTRKVLGGSAFQLFVQFMTESLLVAFIAEVLALLLVLLAIPAANSTLFADEPVYMISYLNLGLFLAGVLLLIGLGTGIYPAIILSRISVYKALKNNLSGWQAGMGRKVLVVFQNMVAQALIVCTVIMVMQVRFLKNTDRGFDRKFVVMLPIGIVPETKKQQFGEGLKQLPQVVSYSYCYRAPSSDSQRGSTIDFDNRTQWETWPARYAIGDTAYVRTFGLHLIAGRNITENKVMPEFVINQKMATMLHMKSDDDIIGKSLNAGDGKGVIVGIVQDFNVKSLIEPIEPSVLYQAKDQQQSLAVKLSGNNISAALSNLRKKYLQVFPDQVFNYEFVDDQIDKLYQKESLQQRLIWIASSLAILISSMGMLGLISLITLQRTKEIGIRKVLGASVTRISVMLSAGFLAPVLIALLIASPLSWWVMNKWLQGFAYRVDIQWWIFALAGIVAVLIALITVSTQAIKAAMANPVESLK